jgi:hypothetical protein
MSGYTGDITIDDGDLGDMEFIQKPFPARVLLERLKALLANR